MIRYAAQSHGRDASHVMPQMRVSGDTCVTLERLPAVLTDVNRVQEGSHSWLGDDRYEGRSNVNRVLWTDGLYCVDCCAFLWHFPLSHFYTLINPLQTFKNNGLPK